MNLFKLMATIGVDSSQFETGVKKAEGSVSNLAGFIKKVGITAAVGAIGKASIDMGMTFEASMSQVAATMGMTKDEIANGSKSFKLLESAAKQAGATTKFSATESAEALNYLALAGYDAETAVKTLPKVLNLAAAGGIDLAYASDLVTDSMSALGLKTKDADRFIDQMAKTSQKSNTNVAQLGEAILTVGGTAKVLKGGTVELNTQLGILADNGIKSAEGGTLLRNMILSLSAPTDKASKLMKKLGLEVHDASGNMRATNEIFNDLNKILGTMTQEQRTKVLSELFNKVDLKGANALLANSGQRFNELSKQIANSEGAAQNMAETMQSNLKGAVDNLQSGLEGLGIAAYEKFKKPLTKAVNEATNVIQGLITVLQNGNLDGILGVIAVAIGAIATQMLIVKGVGFAMMIGGMVSNLVKAVSMVKSFSGALAILNTVLAANPIGIVAGGIGILVSGFLYLWTTCDGFRNFWINLWNGMIYVFNNSIQGIVRFFTETLPSAIQNAITWFSTLPEAISAFLDNAIIAISNWAAQTAQKALEAGRNFINNTVQWFSQLHYHIGFAIGYALASVNQWAIDMWNKAKETGSNFVNSITEWFQQLPTRISQFVNNSFNKVSNWSINMWNKAKETGMNFVNAITQWFQQLPSKIWNWLSNTIQRVISFGRDMNNKASEIGRNFTNWLISSVRNLPDQFTNIGRDIVRGVWNGIVGMGNWLISKVTSFFSGIVDGAKAALGIHSPSRVFRDEVGKWIPAGVEVGMNKEMPSLQKSVETNMASLANIEPPTIQARSVVNNDSSEMIRLLRVIADKSFNLELDGRELVRGIAPYQSELDEYKMLRTI